MFYKPLLSTASDGFVTKNLEDRVHQVFTLTDPGQSSVAEVVGHDCSPCTLINLQLIRRSKLICEFMFDVKTYRK